MKKAPTAQGRRPPAGLIFAGCLIALATSLPAIYLVVRAMEASVDDVVRILVETRTALLVANTIGLTAAVTGAALVLGIPAAWCTVRTDLPFRRTWTALNALPLVIPSYLGGYAFVSTLGPRGLVQSWLEPFGLERLPEIYGFFGAWLVLTVFTYPYVFLSVRGGLLRIDPALEEAAATLGEKRWGIFFRVVLPQIWPAIASGALLVALYTLHDFGAVSLLRFDSFSRAIYVSYEGSFDRTEAAVLSLVLVLITLIVVAGEIRMRPRTSIYRAHAAGGRTASVKALGGLRWPVFAAFCLLAGTALLVPLTAMGFWLWRGLQAGPIHVVALREILNSLSASALGAVLALGAAWPLALLAVRFPGRLSHSLEKASFVAFALPGIVVALALVFLGIRAVPVLYQTRLMLGFAYTILFLPLATGALKTSLAQFSPRIEEAARTLGASRWDRLRLVSLPAHKPGLVAACALVFLSGMKELPATLLLAPIGFPTLATRLWSATQAASFAAAAPAAIALVVLSSAPLAWLLSKDEDLRLFAD